MYLWLFLIVLGFLTGVYGTIVGLGGGFIMVPVLLLLYPDKSPAMITSISLAAIFVNALSGTTAYARMKRINYRAGVSFALAAIPGAILGAVTASYLPRQLFELVFGLLLIVVSVFLLRSPDRRSKMAAAEGTQTLSRSSLRTGIGASVFVGFLSSLFGIGGGIIYVPMMVYALHFPVHIATSTSQFILLISSLSGTITYLAGGLLMQGIGQALALASGILFGAQVGAYLSNRLKGAWIVRALALAIGITGLKFVLSLVF